MFAHNLTRDEATTRSALLRTDSYRISLDLTGNDGAGQPVTAPETTFASTSVARFEATGAEPTHIDLIADRVIEASLNGVELDPATFTGSRLPFTPVAGENELTVRALCRYSRSGEGLHRFVDPADQRVYLYTQFEVSDARRVFACFEQPDLKATYTLDVLAPPDWTVIANSTGDEPVAVDEHASRWHFPTTLRFSTYLVGLVAGHYARVHDEHTTAAGTLPMSILCRRSVLASLDAERIFSITKSGFDVFEPSFDFAFPFGKYDQAFVPEYNMGAMENVGCITLRDDMIFRSRTTQATYENRANTILHELAHMWFGDLVTMVWWDDLWLKESFAEWASHFAQSQIDAAAGGDPRHAWATFANQRKTWAYRQDQLPSTHPIGADMVDLEAVASNFDGITYAKGASVLRQLVAFVGRDAFLAGARDYFARHAFGNTRLRDLLATLERSSGRDLGQWSAQWLETAGVNTLRPVFELDEQGAFSRFAIEQSAIEAHPMLRDHRLAVGLYRRDDADQALRRSERIEIDVSGPLTEVPELVGIGQPELVVINDDDLTYAKVRLDPRSAATVVSDLSRVDSALARAVCWGATWDMCRDAELPAGDYAAIVLNAVAVEDDLAAVRSVLRQGQSGLNSYTPPEQRSAAVAGWETGLSGLLEQAEAGSDHQLAFAHAYAHAVTSSAGAERLAGWLTATAVPQGLVIDADLRWLVLTDLARLGACDQAGIEAELGRDATVSGAESAAGARSALADPSAKEAAWRAAVDENVVSNEEQRAICMNFWQPGQATMLAGYIERYQTVALDIAAGAPHWSSKGVALQENALEFLFPLIGDDPAAIEQLSDFLDTAELTPMVRRLAGERLDDARRSQRCQQAVLPS